MLDDVWAPRGFGGVVLPGGVVVVVGAGGVALDVVVVVPGVVAAGACVVVVVVDVAVVVAEACGVLGGNIPPLNVTVLKWQLLQGALVMGWFGVLPTAILLLWQLAQGPSAWT